jgi:organic radical activating enzyme
MTDIRLAETFASINGEGSLVGVPMFFARFAGCSVHHCPLHPYRGGACDTDWQYQFSKNVEQIADEAKASKMPWLCITGGEPLDQEAAMYKLIAAAHERGLRVTVQTIGTIAVNEDVIDWLVVSPKRRIEHLKQIRGHELKVLNSPYLLEDYGGLRAWATLTYFMHLWLQPVWAKDGKANLAETAKMVLRAHEIGAGPWKLSLQQHKYWGGR